MQTARKIRRTSQSQREDIIYLPYPLPPGTELLQIIPHPGAQRAGLVPGVAWEDGNRSN